ncbi:MAG: hypothetical protein JJU32_01330 [Phormidium sp. BM_Day4_Bin.17]|nr:hypothetical protein [Phormidium sp. BM_Day4_Bin.17]UCJ12425.1 MAG: hypothetical protein JWS08_00930 [Phormidium sp. PBR-2020]
MYPKLEIVLDGRPVEKITAFLFDKGGNDDPKPLQENAGKSFIGSYVLGMGFTFDDTNSDATPIAEMHRLIEQNPKNAEVIFPYIGGSEVNSSPTHKHHRYVINFGEMMEEEAREYPKLMAIVEEKVKPQRLAQKREIRARYWWRFGETTPALFKAIAQCDRVLVISRVGQHGSFAFLPSKMVYSESLVVFPLSSYSAFCTLQSRFHEIWARFFGSSMKDDLRYTPSDGFETFPFPKNWESDPTLEAIGETYYNYRAELMIKNDQGLTDTYNRFHDPNETDPDIEKLRELHQAMDQAVLTAYGWDDLNTDCGFVLDYLDGNPEDFPAAVQERVLSGDLFFPHPEEALAFDSQVRSSRRKLPWRYRWSEATHNEVLARLLNLNQERYEAEVAAGKPKKKSSKSRKRGNPKTKDTSSTLPIPGLDLNGD